MFAGFGGLLCAEHDPQSYESTTASSDENGMSEPSDTEEEYEQDVDLTEQLLAPFTEQQSTNISDHSDFRGVTEAVEALDEAWEQLAEDLNPFLSHFPHDHPKMGVAGQGEEFWA